MVSLTLAATQPRLANVTVFQKFSFPTIKCEVVVFPFICTDESKRATSSGVKNFSLVCVDGLYGEKKIHFHIYPAQWGFTIHLSFFLFHSSLHLFRTMRNPTSKNAVWAIAAFHCMCVSVCMAGGGELVHGSHACVRQARVESKPF